MIRYPHGFFDGGVWDNEYAPTITTSSWECNNYVLEIHNNRDTDKGTERGGEDTFTVTREQSSLVARYRRSIGEE